MSEKKDRREFMKTAGVATAGVVVGAVAGSPKEAKAQFSSDSTAITEFLDSGSASLLTDAAQNLTRGDLHQLNLHIHGDGATDLSTLNNYSVEDLRSVQNAFHNRLAGSSTTQGFSTQGDFTACCCCTPCCTCAASVAKPKRLV